MTIATQPFSLEGHLYRQLAFSLETFGPSQRTAGVIDHIRKELEEVSKDPDDITEWTDLLILVFDGALRRGFTPEEIISALVEKQTKNENRVWPDWRTMPEDKAIEHVKGIND